MPGTHLVLPFFDDSHVPQGGVHVLYMFSDNRKYINNAASFIYEGIRHDAAVIVAETEERIIKLREELRAKRVSKEQLEQVTFVEAAEFYLDDQQQLDATGAGNTLTSIVQPHLEQGRQVYTWGYLPIVTDLSMLERLMDYERNCNDYILDQQMISVCAYDAFITPSYIQNELLKTHTYLMTDEQCCDSPFYNREHHQPLSLDEFDRLQQMERQNQLLKDENNQLAVENQTVKLKNQVIEQSELRLRTLMKELPIPILIRRGTDILYCNDLAQEQFAIRDQKSVEETVLKPFFETYERSRIESSTSQLQEHQCILHNEKKKHYVVKSIDILFEAEPASLHSFVDITREKENEGLIIRSEKMNIAGLLAASIAHELRNPLTAIKGFFHMLKGMGGGKELYYQVIDEELSRIEQISSELLTLAKPHSENRKRHDMVQLIREVQILLSSQSVMKNIEIIVQTDREQLYIHCEATKMKQVFINLIKNAIEAMKQGGDIVINVTGSEKYIQIEVIDQGSGIPQELIEKIGEPFYTTKEKGTGIGLMVCYQIIESHGGTIRIDSEVGRGTTFTITLPA
ncbi:ATP-binding protein [Paenibacillus turpanensis]|uniref:ATP-binding protein n=1 Tax=Paenibacillus turpanensis TaxID=2689078 RepID=UPI001407FB5F|nr:ATP-binding protein [Paenibacillus turpanensis]